LLEASVDAYRTVGVETVLSTAKYRKLIRAAKAHGFEVRLLYVTLDSADRNVARVRARVKQGGHSVPEDKIRARREKSFRQLPWFLKEADMALIYDNSGAEPKLIGQKLNAVLTVDPAAPAEIKRAVAKLKT
jgi:predicted ABC-type ATPase